MSQNRAEYQREYRRAHPEKFRKYEVGRSRKRPYKYRPSKPRDRTIIGIDGEGYTSKDGRHLYVYVAACTEDGPVSDLYDPAGIPSEVLLEWLLSLPRAPLKVGFSLGYDFAKWVEGLDNERIYALIHPAVRRSRRGRLRPVGIPSGKNPRYILDKLSTRFAVRRPEGKSCVVWDVFKFFQCSFVKAVGLWDVGTEKERADIAAMKAKRGEFEGISEDERAYCRHECILLSKLVSKLLKAHEDAGLELRSYYGPGSTASIMLGRMGADKEKLDIETPDDAPDPYHAFNCAFFGGRFETSVVGPVPGPLYSYDIASAYPYAMAQLPCMKHGKWQWVPAGPKLEKRLKDCKLACCRYHIDRTSKDVAWGPLPHRLPDGNIVFPIVSAGGWAWLPEIRAAMRLHEGVRVTGAWVLSGRCKCFPPFKDEIVGFYKIRLQWGKDGRGLVSKVGLNSCYGKCAQREGAARFRNIVIAGMITSLTRAMLLDAIGCSTRGWDILEVATDSITSRVPLKLPLPVKLGTEKIAAEYGGKTLGTWEEKVHEKGLFFIRPGLRFSLDPEAAVKTTAARGLGTTVLHNNRQFILDEWAKYPMQDVRIQQPSLFWGAKSSIRRKLGAPLPDGSYPWEYVRDSKYGRWQNPEPRVVSYAAAPKRAAVFGGGDDRIGPPRPGAAIRGAFRLAPWALVQSPEAVSCAYGEAPTGPLALEAMLLRDLEEEQPEAFGLGGVAGDE